MPLQTPNFPYFILSPFRGERAGAGGAVLSPSKDGAERCEYGLNKTSRVVTDSAKKELSTLRFAEWRSVLLTSAV